LNEKNHEIVSGIEYASKFQSIVFPKESDLKKHIEGAFILHKPLEIVSGDLPFVLNDGHFLFVAAVDCIGHGVSASMLSIMTYFNLSEIIRSKHFHNCSQVLMELHRRLEVRSNEAKSAENNLLVSIDLALIKIDLNTNEVQFSGANLPLIIQSGDQVQVIKGNSFSIGEYWNQRKLEYIDHHQSLNRGDRLFIFSDGFFHQFGGVELKQKLSKKRTAEWIGELSYLPISDMKLAMDQKFEYWRGDAPQTDDVVFIGLEI
jgi:serine phosphatase RsbU (regulator of sigma subunit)